MSELINVDEIGVPTQICPFTNVGLRLPEWKAKQTVTSARTFHGGSTGAAACETEKLGTMGGTAGSGKLLLRTTEPQIYDLGKQSRTK